MRCSPRTAVAVALALTIFVGYSSTSGQTPQTPPPAKPPASPTPAGQTPPKPPATGTSGTVRSAGARIPITVTVTTLDGKPLGEVWVKAVGPVDREGSTDASGTVSFQNVSAGSYRLRFEHDQFVTFEREVAVTPGKPVKIAVALTAAPPPPPPPKIEPVAPPPPQAAPLGDYQPMSVDIPDMVEKNYIGGAPVKRLSAGCTASSTSTLLQVRDPLAEHTHNDADELLYVVAGEGTHRIGGRDYALAGGVFAVVPRGVPHAIMRRGRQPLVMISTLSGPPCQPPK